jgi:hypothetical protein
MIAGYENCVTNSEGENDSTHDDRRSLDQSERVKGKLGSSKRSFNEYMRSLRGIPRSRKLDITPGGGPKPKPKPKPRPCWMPVDNSANPGDEGSEGSGENTGSQFGEGNRDEDEYGDEDEYEDGDESFDGKRRPPPPTPLPVGTIN